jgi:hypothetical protein
VWVKVKSECVWCERMVLGWQGLVRASGPLTVIFLLAGMVSEGLQGASDSSRVGWILAVVALAVAATGVCADAWLQCRPRMSVVIGDEDAALGTWQNREDITTPCLRHRGFLEDGSTGGCAGSTTSDDWEGDSEDEDDHDNRCGDGAGAKAERVS